MRDEQEGSRRPRVIEVDPAEPFAANALPIRDTVVYPAAFPRTRALLERHGIRVEAVDVSELAKAGAGVTCCSVIFTVGLAHGIEPVQT